MTNNTTGLTEQTKRCAMTALKAIIEEAVKNIPASEEKDYQVIVHTAAVIETMARYMRLMPRFSDALKDETLLNVTEQAALEMAIEFGLYLAQQKRMKTPENRPTPASASGQRRVTKVKKP